MTLGQLMFYGGIVGLILFAILIPVTWNIYESKKKSMKESIEKDLK